MFAYFHDKIIAHFFQYLLTDYSNYSFYFHHDRININLIYNFK